MLHLLQSRIAATQGNLAPFSSSHLAHSSLSWASDLGGSIPTLRHSSANAFGDRILASSSFAHGILCSASHISPSKCFLYCSALATSTGTPLTPISRVCLLSSRSCSGHLSPCLSHSSKVISASLRAYSVTSLRNSSLINSHCLPFILARVCLLISTPSKACEAPASDPG